MNIRGEICRRAIGFPSWAFVNRSPSVRTVPRPSLTSFCSLPSNTLQIFDENKFTCGFRRIVSTEGPKNEDKLAENSAEKIKSRAKVPSIVIFFILFD